MHLEGGGAWFCVPAPAAARVELCLFDEIDAPHPQRTLSLERRQDGLFAGWAPDVRHGLTYGYRAAGDATSPVGSRFDPEVLLVDPYARAVQGVAEERPRCVVVDDPYDWGDDTPPRTPWEDTAILECHVRGLTARHGAVPPADRGTYAGLCGPAIVEHLHSLGVTAVELLPVQQEYSEATLARRGLRNYWGYCTLGWFAPSARFAHGDDGRQVREFRDMVRALHAAGIEVILDVVYNHTPEGRVEDGQLLSLAGLDRAGYYHIDELGRDIDHTGCGNTLDISRPLGRRLVLDSLRYWVQEMHVDGFRFDLAPSLLRGARGIELASPFLRALESDPVLSPVKLIAEPWDLGPDGYLVGRFPRAWSEWNDRFQRTLRSVWRGDAVAPAELGRRLLGSRDIYGPGDRPLRASVNYICTHDGFTLRDLVSYERKHNEANGEHNRDGNDDNLSCNWGAEGPTEDSLVRAVRAQIERNLAASLALARGVPLLPAGSELGHSQAGNNNAYCQDSPLTWIDWEPDPEGRALLRFTRGLFALRRDLPEWWRDAWGRGAEPTVRWWGPDGMPLSEEDCDRPRPISVAASLHPKAPAAGAPTTDDAAHPRGTGATAPPPLLLLLNATPTPYRFALAPLESTLELPDGRWQWLLDTARPDGPFLEVDADGIPVARHSLALLLREADSP